MSNGEKGSTGTTMAVLLLGIVLGAALGYWYASRAPRVGPPPAPGPRVREVGFELKDGRDAGCKFIEALKMFYHVANIGDARSLAIHPASTTHSQLTPEEQLKTGVTDGYVRLSVGIEHIDDILADLDQALKAA